VNAPSTTTTTGLRAGDRVMACTRHRVQFLQRVRFVAHAGTVTGVRNDEVEVALDEPWDGSAVLVCPASYCRKDGGL